MHAFFNEAKTSRKDFVAQAIAVFDDRASLRVTDVSSVVFRDFSIWYSYYYLENNTLPGKIPTNLITEAHDILQDRDDQSFEVVLSNVINIERWGEFL
jgi:hypothetical protein